MPCRRIPFPWRPPVFSVKALIVPTPAAKRFTIAHELGHVYYEDGLLNAAWDPLLIVGGVGGVAKAAKRGAVAAGGAIAVAVPLLVGVRVAFKWLQELRADQFAIENGHQQGGEDYMTSKMALNEVMGNRHADSSPRMMWSESSSAAPTARLLRQFEPQTALSGAPLHCSAH